MCPSGTVSRCYPATLTWARRSRVPVTYSLKALPKNILKAQSPDRSSVGPAEQEVEATHAAAEKASISMFVDAHNTGYYVNSYTTKLNPSMDNVLRKLLDGVRRLHGQWESEVATVAAEDKNAVDKRQAAFRKCMQVLSRFETCFRRASWKSGSEMVFPILFGHMAFMTHRCWTVYMKYATWLAAEAWRQAYGQVVTQQACAAQHTTSLQYKLPSGETVALAGWRDQEARRDGCVHWP